MHPKPAHPQQRPALPTPPPLPELPRERFDADLADSASGNALVDELHAIAERSASFIDDAVNTTEASEDRSAAHQAQAMR